MRLAWLAAEDWERLLVGPASSVECYGWFDRRPYRGSEDSVFVAHRPP